MNYNNFPSDIIDLVSNEIEYRDDGWLYSKTTNKRIHKHISKFFNQDLGVKLYWEGWKNYIPRVENIYFKCLIRANKIQDKMRKFAKHLYYEKKLKAVYAELAIDRRAEYEFYLPKGEELTFLVSTTTRDMSSLETAVRFEKDCPLTEDGKELHKLYQYSRDCRDKVRMAERILNYIVIHQLRKKYKDIEKVLIIKTTINGRNYMFASKPTGYGGFTYERISFDEYLEINLDG